MGLIPYLLTILVGTYSMLDNVSRRVGTILLPFTMAMYDYYLNSAAFFLVRKFYILRCLLGLYTLI